MRNHGDGVGRAEAPVDGGRGGGVEALLASVADNAANFCNGHEEALLRGADVAADGHASGEIAADEAAIDEYCGRAVAFAATLAEHDGDCGGREVSGGDEAGGGEDLLVRVLFALAHDELDLLLAGYAGEVGGGGCGFDAGQSAECVERGVDALREALHIGGLAPASADLQGEDVGWVEAG
jgi:hypothetical protein